MHHITDLGPSRWRPARLKAPILAPAAPAPMPRRLTKEVLATDLAAGMVRWGGRPPARALHRGHGVLAHAGRAATGPGPPTPGPASDPTPVNDWSDDEGGGGLRRPCL